MVARKTAKSDGALLIVEDDPGLQKQLRWSFDDYEVDAMLRAAVER